MLLFAPCFRLTLEVELLRNVIDNNALDYAEEVFQYLVKYKKYLPLDLSKKYVNKLEDIVAESQANRTASREFIEAIQQRLDFARQVFMKGFVVTRTFTRPSVPMPPDPVAAEHEEEAPLKEKEV
jgi:hypothetical protein